MSAKYDKQLLYFCKVGDIAGVTKILSSPNSSLDLNCKDQDGLTPLLLAASTNKIEIVQLLINAGADVDVTSQNKNSCLHYVSKDGRVEIVKSLIAAHANPNIKNEEGSTALHEACRNGKSAIVQLLLDAGAVIDAQDEKLYTPLHTASFYQQSDVMKILISSGSNIDLKDKNGQMAVDIASPERKHDKIFENPKLLDSNSKRRSITSDGNNQSSLNAFSFSSDAGDANNMSATETSLLDTSTATEDPSASATATTGIAISTSGPAPSQDVSEGEAEHSDGQGEPLNAADGSRVSSYRSSTNSLSPIQIVIHVPDDPDSDHSAGSSNVANNVKNHHISFDKATGPSAAAAALSKTPSGSTKSHSPPSSATAATTATATTGAGAGSGSPQKPPTRSDSAEAKGCCIVS